MSLRRFNDADARLLRSLINRYGLDGVAVELRSIVAAYKQQDPKRYGAPARQAARFEYVARRMMGTAPVKLAA